MPEENKKLSPPSTKKNVKYNEKWVNNVRIQYRTIEEDRMKGVQKIQAIANKNNYILNILFNEDRGKFQALVDFEGRRQSLSFFSTAKNALENLELYISLLNGGVQENNSKMVGD